MHPSAGGRKHCLLIVDEATDYAQNQYLTSPNEISTTYTPYTYIPIEHLVIGHALPMVHYNQQKCMHSPTSFIHGSHEVSQPISTLTPQNYHHVHVITYMFGNTPHFSTEILGHVIFPPQGQR